MTEIRFYHLERQELDEALPALVAKAHANGHKILLKAANEQDLERLNSQLWTYNPNSFLPHGSEKDGFAEKQPIYLTTKDENPNGADVMILTGGASSAMHGQFSLCCEMLDGRDKEAVESARANWKKYKEAGYTVTYWKQGASGWEKKDA
jgi:DNA polymerase-3 subunit chi